VVFRRISSKISKYLIIRREIFIRVRQINSTNSNKVNKIAEDVA
jgi:hypothetical protein